MADKPDQTKEQLFARLDEQSKQAEDLLFAAVETMQAIGITPPALLNPLAGMAAALLATSPRDLQVVLLERFIAQLRGGFKEAQSQFALLDACREVLGEEAYRKVVLALGRREMRKEERS